MNTTTLPHTDISVSTLAFGCWGITSDFHWGSRDESESLATIQAALDAGINFFDTAEVYGEGNSEQLLGKALAGRRQQVVIATKMLPDSMRPDQIPEACERSLRRLGTDYIDLYQIHWPNRDTPLADSWAAMLQLKEQGKVRAVGVCNHGLGDLSSICELEVPATNQLPYNLLWRAIEHKILPRCVDKKIGVLAYSPLMHGLLSGQYESADEVPDGRSRSRHFSTDRPMARHGEPGCEGQTFAALDAIREIAESLDRTMADVALAWVAARTGVTAVIVGARNPDQLAENIATLANPLSADAIARLDKATQSVNDVLGPNPDMWQGAGNTRYR